MVQTQGAGAALGQLDQAQLQGAGRFAAAQQDVPVAALQALRVHGHYLRNGLGESLGRSIRQGQGHGQGEVFAAACHQDHGAIALGFQGVQELGGGKEGAHAGIGALGLVVQVAFYDAQHHFLLSRGKATPTKHRDPFFGRHPVQFEGLAQFPLPSRGPAYQHLQGKEAMRLVQVREAMPQRMAGTPCHFDKPQPCPAAFAALFALEATQEHLLHLLHVHAVHVLQRGGELLGIGTTYRIDRRDLVLRHSAAKQEHAATLALRQLGGYGSTMPNDVLVGFHHNEGELATHALVGAFLLLQELLAQGDQACRMLVMEQATVQEGEPVARKCIIKGVNGGKLHSGVDRSNITASLWLLRCCAARTGTTERRPLPAANFAASMITEAQLERTRLYVRRWFARFIPPILHFHDLEHTLTVTRTAKAIGRAMELGTQDLALLELAALFHDTGYAVAYAGHEDHSAQLAANYLKKLGLSGMEIRRVRQLILATRLKAEPRGVLQEVLRDADSSKAGQVDFIERSESLRKELEVSQGKKIAPANWLNENLAYLESHRFHTAYARERYGKQKELNMEALRARAATPKKERPALPKAKELFHDRDLSWLSFNERVLQEAKDPSVPLLERVKFLAIYSNNLDEFYRVRVASLRSLSKLKKTTRTVLGIPPSKLVQQINKKALGQQMEFGRIHREQLLPALAEHGIRFLRKEQLSPEQRTFVRRYAKEKVMPLVNTAGVRAGNAPFIEDRKLYFVCRLKPKSKGKDRIVLVNIPSDALGRFLLLPATKGRTEIMFLDDVVRMGLNGLFADHKVTECHAIKLSRDAELYLDEEFVGNVKEKVRKSLRKRTTGVPSRFLYDSAMPRSTLRALKDLLGLAAPDLVPGGRYHNFNDLMKLPVSGHAALRDRAWPTVPDPASADGRNTFKALQKGDLLWHFPYHDFGNVVRWLQAAAADPAVRHIAITLYRVAEGSAVCAALVDALQKGKRVTVFVEVQARFDERSNLFWGEALEQAGAEVRYSYANLKVHCKLCLIERQERGRSVRYAYLGTGNFNESTSRIYADMALLTKRPALTNEVAEVFKHLMDRSKRPALKHLLMAPTTLRDRLEAYMDKEIEQALLGNKATILLKLNSLEDRALIRKLHAASNAGVQVRLIIRGLCCLVPGVAGMSANIQAISIVDRFLEHTRVYQFHNNGRPLVMLSSADWMGRNLDRRIEVAFPVLDEALKTTIMDLMEIQWNDHVKARVIDAEQTNAYRPAKPKAPNSRTQLVTHGYLTRRAKLGSKAKG